jgi:hypothetical protein
LLPGDGEGRNGVCLARRWLDVTTVDAPPVDAQKAGRLAAARDVDPAIRANIHRKVDCALKPGGFLLLEGFAPDYLRYGKGGPKAKEMMFTETATAKKFFSLLNIELFVKLHSGLPSSECHGGFVVVLRLRGRRTPP